MRVVSGFVLFVAIGLMVLVAAGAAQAPPPLDATAQLLKVLSEAPGPSAFEEDVRRVVVNEFAALGAGIEYDGLGSVLATLPGNTAGPGNSWWMGCGKPA